MRGRSSRTSFNWNSTSSIFCFSVRRCSNCARCTSSSMIPAARRAAMSAPTQKPASVGRSCVVEETSACRGYSSLAPEFAALVLFEVEQPVAQDAEARQRLAYRRLHRAQILAHHHHPIAHALQRQNAHEILVALAHVGALGSVHAVGNPEQAEEAHHVIDAQRPAVPAVLANRFREQAVAVLAMPQPSSAAETPSPAPWERNRRAANPRGTPPHRTAGAPTGRCRSGPWPAPGRDTARSKGAGRAPIAAPPPVAGRSAIAGTGRTLRGASVSRGRRAFPPSRGPGKRAGQSVHTHRSGFRAVQLFVQRAVGGETLQQVALALAERLKCARPWRSRSAVRAETARTRASGSAF